jgi:branched-chain amino acid transport system substrate-binding protein
VVALSLLLAVTGCGTRLSHQAVEADTAPATVSLDPASTAALRAGPTARQAAIGGATPPFRTAFQAPRSVSSGSAAAGRAPAVQRATPYVASPREDVARPREPRAPQAKAAADTVAATTTNVSSSRQCAGQSAPVAIGQVGTFSGVAGPITAGARSLLAAWVEDLNSRGGLACHPVKLYSQDDGADPARAAAEVQDLVARRHVVALVGNLVALSMGGFRPAVEAARIPVIGTAAGTKDDFDSPWFYPAGGSNDDIAVGLIANAVATGHTRLGVLYCVEAAGCTEVYQFVRDHAAKAAGADLVYAAPVSIAQPDYTAQCLNARDAKVDVLGLAVDGASMTRVAHSCAAIGYHPLLASSAQLLTQQDAADPTLRSFGLTSATPQVPFILDDTPGLRAYHQVFDRYLPNQPPDGASMLAWAAAQLFETAVDKVADQARQGPLTTALILDGLGKIHEDTLGGITGPLTFTPAESHATSNGCVFYMTLDTTGWTAPRGSQPVCPRH